MKKEKFIDFIITQKCTYNCVYCSQSKNETKEKKSADKKTIAGFLKFLDKIKTDYEITITGGEALLHEDFFNLIYEVKKRGFKINLISNFSFESDKYEKIFNILNTSLNNFDISFHLDEMKKQYGNFDELANKLVRFLEKKPQNTNVNFLIPLYDLTAEKEHITKKLIEFCQSRKINYSFQQIRFLNQYLSGIHKEKYFKNEKIIKSYARSCSAGYKSVVIYQDGNAYRCYSSRFIKSNYLGNINDENFKLASKAAPCVFKKCTCPKPVLYNQLSEEKDFIKTILLRFENLFYFPYFMIKNKNILKSKLLQFLKLKF